MCSLYLSFEWKSNQLTLLSFQSSILIWHIFGTKHTKIQKWLKISNFVLFISWEVLFIQYVKKRYSPLWAFFVILLMCLLLEAKKWLLLNNIWTVCEMTVYVYQPSFCFVQVSTNPCLPYSIHLHLPWGIRPHQTTTLSLFQQTGGNVNQLLFSHP